VPTAMLVREMSDIVAVAVVWSSTTKELAPSMAYRRGFVIQVSLFGIFEGLEQSLFAG
jgi:hypothetical protein